MKTKFNGILTLLLALVVQISFAQEKTISGVVSDETGPLPGVSVLKKGTAQGTETDFDGKYSVKVKTGDILVFSFVGMETIEKTVGTSSKIDVTMQNGNVLDEIVVNALGLNVDKAKASSSISNVSAESITKSGENSVIQGMAGKASGVQIINSSGDAGASAYIQIRGQSTITRSLQPLIVIDGIPVSNDERGSGTDGVTQQSRLGDINPEDIADVKILKGASAAAVWGSRAGNGVIVITTKKGRGNGDFSVNLTASYSFDKANKVFPLQDRFGKGTNGVYSSGTTGNSWGDRISDRKGGADVFDTTSTVFFEGENGTKIYPTVEKNSKKTYNQSNIDGVFRNALTSRFSASISGRTKGGSSHFFSLSNTNQEGIIKNNFYDRITTRYNTETKVTDELTFKGSFAYSNVKSDRIQQGSNLSGLLLGLYRTPADFDNTVFKGTRWVNGTPIKNSQRSYRRELGTNKGQSAIYNNPLWTVYEQTNPNIVNRYIAGTQLQYRFANWLTLIGRLGIDHYTDSRQSFFPINSSGNAAPGRVTEDFLSDRQTNIDFIATSNFDLNDNINLDLLAGLNLNQRGFEHRGGSYSEFILDSRKIFYTNATSSNRDTYIDQSKTRTSAGYLTAAFDYNSMLYLTLTGRAEVSSTFASGKTFFYPSVEFGYKFSNSKVLEGSFLSNGKLRLTYGKVGLEPAAYRTTTYYVNAQDSEGWGPGYNSGAYDGAFVRSGTKGNSDLKPEVKTEFEAGLDLGFLNNRVTLNTTYYQNRSEDVLMNVAIAGSSGFSRKYANAATLENRGFEIDLGLKLIDKEDFSWDVNANWSTNKNNVVSLSGTKSLFLAGFTGSSSRAVEGQPVGVLWGGRFARDEKDKYVLDQNGFPTVAPQEGVIGNPNPDWRAGLGTTIKYKGFSISTLFDSSIGGEVWNGTAGALTNFGRTIETANDVTVSAADALKIKNARGTFIKDISYTRKNDDGTYTVRGNLKDFGGGTVLLDQAWYTGVGSGFGPVGEQFVQKASWVKWRELTLSYNFENETLREKVGLNSAQLSLTGRNLWYWSESDLGIDPESNLTGASNGRGLQYFNHPVSKSYLVTLKLNF